MAKRQTRSFLTSDRFRLTFVTGDQVDFVTFYLAAKADRLFLASTPARNWLVISWTSSLCKPSSWAICWLDRLRPIKYRHSTQTFSGW